MRMLRIIMSVYIRVYVCVVYRAYVSSVLTWDKSGMKDRETKLQHIWVL